MNNGLRGRSNNAKKEDQFSLDSNQSIISISRSVVIPNMLFSALALRNYAAWFYMLP